MAPLADSLALESHDNRDPTEDRPCHAIGKAAINRDNWTIPAVDPRVLLEFDS